LYNLECKKDIIYRIVQPGKDIFGILKYYGGVGWGRGGAGRMRQ